MKKLKRKHNLIAEINITPFTDVILVLLIIFMILTPLMSQADLKVSPVKVKESKATTITDIQKINIKVSQEGIAYLNKKAMTLDELNEEVSSLYKKNPDLHILLRAEPAAQYRYIAKVLDLLSASGIKNINVAVEL